MSEEIVHRLSAFVLHAFEDVGVAPRVFGKTSPGSVQELAAMRSLRWRARWVLRR